jgi:hypothetical protein
MSWGKKTVPSASAGFETPPAGSHGAVLVAIIDLGTHAESFKGEAEKDTHSVYMVWELTGCQMTGSAHNHLIGRKYTFSLHEKSGLRKMIKSWRNKDLGVGEDFDVLAMLGRKCMVSVSHTENGEKVYANLDGVSAVPAGMPVNDAKRKPVARQVASSDPVPDWLPFIYGEKVEEIVKRAKEVRPAGAPAQPPTHAPAAMIAEEAIPF